MSLTIPGLGESYSLAELPRIPDLLLSARVAIPESQKSNNRLNTDTIDLGISKLIIASYVLKPTPKLVWSYPLSPNTVVDCMDADDNLYIVGLTERLKHKLLLIQRGDNESATTSEIQLLAPASTVKFSLSKYVYVLLKTGQVQLFQYQTEDELSLSKGPELINAKGSLSKAFSVVYHTFISNHNFKNKNDLLFYVEANKSMKKVRFHLFALDGAKSFEIYETSVESSLHQNLIFTYADGLIYAFDTVSKQLSSRSLMKPQESLKSISLSSLVGETTDKTLFSVIAVAPERILLSFKSLVLLINFKFESLLGDHTNHSGNEVYLAFGLPIAGSTTESRASFALYLNFEDKTKTCKLKLILVDVGLNTLSESLGKSFHSDASDAAWSGLPHLNESDLQKANSDSVAEMNSVLKSLTKLKSKGKAQEFDRQMIKFLKNGSDKFKSYKFSSVTDRVVDQKYITLILSLIFQIDEDSNVQIIDESFLPENSMRYLLTHPLYPAAYASGVLVVLSQLNQPELLKQAIDHCSALSIDELTAELINLIELTDEMSLDEQDEAQYILSFLKATVDRLVKDFSVAQITSKLQEIMNFEFETANKKLDRMLSVLISINTNNSWTLVQAVIDVGGLFNWNIPTISKLSEITTSKVDALTQNSYILTLTNQAILGTEQVNKKGKKTPALKVVDNIHEITNQRSQLDAILTISNNTTNKKLLADEGIELAKQIPTYSREKLVL